jgi:hypothetical protein
VDASTGHRYVGLTEAAAATTYEQASDHGGTLLTAPYEFVPGRPWMLAYTTNPWGTVLDRPCYAEAFSIWPQPGQLIPPTHVPRPTPEPDGG